MEHLARTEGKRNACRILVRKPKEKNLFKDVRLGVRIILKLILKKYDGVWLRKGQVANSCKNDNESSGSVNWQGGVS
jgi:hypothetical protein